MQQIEYVLNDRGSKYAVSGEDVYSRKDAEKFIRLLCKKKKYQRATHNTWALLLADGTQIKQDDGESGAGSIILKMLEREQLVNHIVVVTRWYGGVHLGADRFRHVKTCVNAYLSAFEQPNLKKLPTQSS